MINYSRITNLAELDEAQRNLKAAIERKGESVMESYNALKAYYSPMNLVASGVRSISSVIPFDRMLLFVIARLKAALKR
jgi:hypothetical protein